MMKNERNPNDQASEASGYFHDGLEAAKNKRYDEAIEDFTKAIALEPYAEYYYERGIAFINIGKLAEAVADNSKAIELDNNNPRYYCNRGFALAGMDKKTEAIEDYSRAIKLNPNEQWYYRNRACTLAEIQKYSEAISDYTQLIYLDSENPDYYYFRGGKYGEQGRQKEAFEDLAIAIELNPEDPAYYCSYGVELYNLGKFDEAVVYFTKAIEFAWDSNIDTVVLNLRNRGNAYRELGQFEKAYADYARGLEISPEDPELFYMRGFAEKTAGDLDAAFEDITKAIRLKKGEPADPEYYGALGDVMTGYGRYEDAVTYYGLAIDQEQDNPEYYKDRAKAYAELGKTKEAEADNAKAAELIPEETSESGNVKAVETSKAKDINATAEKILRVLSEKAMKKSAKMKFVKQRNLLTGSKLGGVPFIPVGGEYPVNPKTGEKLYLLAQINFAETPPLPDYPTEGILQIFISDGDTYGYEFDDLLNKDGWRILFYEDISNPMPRADIVAMMPEYPRDYLELPFVYPENEYRITFEEKDSLISSGDFRFNKIFAELCSDVLPEELKGKRYYDLPYSISYDTGEALWDDTSRIGGYPVFAQDDQRWFDIPKNYEILLQFGSDNDTKDEPAMIWSDSGIAHFFIDPEDLKKRDFSKVIYTWEGC